MIDIPKYRLFQRIGKKNSGIDKASIDEMFAVMVNLDEPPEPEILIQNNTPNNTPDILIPFVIGAEIIDTFKQVIYITFNVPMDQSETPDPFNFNVSLGSITEIHWEDSPSVISLTVSVPYVFGNVVTVGYTQGTNPLKDTSDNLVDSFSNQSVTNNIAEPSVPNELLLTFNNISNADTLISGDSSNVSDWNTIFDFDEGYGFTSVSIINNIVNLCGSNDVDLPSILYTSEFLNPISIVDTLGVVTHLNLNNTSITSPPDLTTFIGLESLYLNNCTELDLSDIDAVLTTFAINYPNLTEVYLTQDPPIIPTPEILAAAQAANSGCTFIVDNYTIGEDYNINFPENSENVVITLNAAEGSVFSLGDDAPAPTGITLTSDAVGDNPVTWYYKMYYKQFNSDINGDDFRSLLSSEGSFVSGDSTTKIIVSGSTPPYWSNGINFALGTVSGVYDKITGTHLNELKENVLTTPYFSLDWVSGVINIPVKKVPTNSTHNGLPPTNINISPNAVGSNPVTWYYKVWQLTSSYELVGLSEEGSYMIGDSTTELIFTCNHNNYNDVDLFLIIKGTTSGIYTNVLCTSFTPPTTFVPIADVQLPYDLLTGVDLPVGEPSIKYFLSLVQLLYIVNYDNDLFEIDPNTGELSFITPPDYKTPLDVNGDNVYDVRVKATLEGNVLESIVSITVTDVSTDAPAPGNITIVPDSIGSDPVTYYYRLGYGKASYEERSLITDEATYQEGDSTTETIFNCDAIPEWAVTLVGMRGTESGVYNQYFEVEETENIDIFNNFGEPPEGVTFELLLSIPVHQIEQQN
jgi:hypothetical protein